MKPAALLLQVLIVGAAIFAYDALRTPHVQPTPAAPDEDYVARRANPAPEGRTPPPPVTLEGADVESRLASAMRRVETLQSRLEAAERSISALRSAPARAPSAPSEPIPAPLRGPASTPGGWAPEGGFGVGEIDPNDPRFDQEEIHRFRAYLEAVEAQRRDERFVTMIEGQLDRLGVTVQGEPREKVVKATIRYRQQVRESLRDNAADGEEARRRRESSMQALQDAYAKEVYQLVPSAVEADKIIQGIGRYPGMGANRLGADR